MGFSVAVAAGVDEMKEVGAAIGEEGDPVGAVGNGDGECGVGMKRG